MPAPDMDAVCLASSDTQKGVSAYLPMNKTLIFPQTLSVPFPHHIYSSAKVFASPFSPCAYGFSTVFLLPLPHPQLLCSLASCPDGSSVFVSLRQCSDTLSYLDPVSCRHTCHLPQPTSPCFFVCFLSQVIAVTSQESLEVQIGS